MSNFILQQRSASLIPQGLLILYPGNKVHIIYQGASQYRLPLLMTPIDPLRVLNNDLTARGLQHQLWDKWSIDLAT